MILTQKQRSSIYSGLAPVIGEEKAEAVLSQFPSTAGEEPVTRDALRAELAEFREAMRTELHVELGHMHDQMRQMAMWMVGATIAGLVGGMGVAAAIGSALG